MMFRMQRLGTITLKGIAHPKMTKNRSLIRMTNMFAFVIFSNRLVLKFFTPYTLADIIPNVMYINAAKLNPTAQDIRIVF